MKVGMGTTVWSQGIQSGHLDGIGHYTQELFRYLSTHNGCEQLIPYVFGSDGSSQVDGMAVERLPKYGRAALWSTISGMSFPVGPTLRQSIDLFHATDHCTPKLRHVPVVATLMDAIPLSHPEWGSQRARKLKNWAWKSSGHWADHVITISEYSKQQVVRHFKIPDQKISVTPLGVDVRYFERFDTAMVEERSRALGLPPRFFLFVGTFQPRKNIDRLLDAHESLPAKIRADVPLLIVGRNGWGAEGVVKRLKAYGQQGAVRWLQGVDDMSKRILMQRAEALIFPSLLEGFGLPVLEGFASGTPVITSNGSSLPEVAGDAAWLLDPYDVRAITEAMATLAEDVAVGRDLVAKGLERARAFTWEACASQTQAVYDRVLGDG